MQDRKKSSDLENFYAITEHRCPESILYYTELSDDLRQRVTEHIGVMDYRKYYGFFTPVDLYPSRPPETPSIDYSRYWKTQELPNGTRINKYGVAEVPSGFHHFWQFVSPLRDATKLSEIENYPLEDMRGWDMSDMCTAVLNAHHQGKVVRGMVVDMYEPAWQIRGYEQFLMDLVERPSWAQCLMERLANQNRLRAIAYAKAGADWLHCGDDVANQNSMMFSRELWNKQIHSHWKKIWQEVHQINPKMKIWYHSDGNIIEIVDDLVEAGVDILNPLQPECLDIDEVHRRHGNRLTFDGCIGTQSTMPFGTPHQVTTRVKDVIEKYGRHGGLIVSPTHVLEPEVPIANIEAFAEACNKYGIF